MAVTKVNGGAAAMQTTGRDLSFYVCTLTGVQTGYTAVGSDFELVIKALAEVATVEIIGTPGTNVFNVALSGHAADAAALTVLTEAAITGSVMTDGVITADPF
jgi:hypothetical protein